MAKRILVPIEGAARSEAIVPIVAAMADRIGSTVRLLRVFPVPQVVTGPHGRTIAYADQEMERVSGAARVDLARLESELAGVSVESIVRFGDPVDEIVLEAEAFDADLIALAGARRGRLRRALAADVADRVSEKASVPTLVLRD
jgi:nucleotide-binding universal stress UspA family protein